jgi:hypothetical protein
MDNDRTIQSSLILSALGWIAAVVAVAAILFWIKPYYENRAYEEGKHARAQENILRVDEWISDRAVENDSLTLMGRVISTSQDSIVFEILTPRLNNPLRTERRQQTALVDGDTLVEVRTLVTRVQNGQQTQEFVATPLSLNTLKSGDEITIIPRKVEESAADSFVAKEVLRILSEQQ